MSYIKDLILGEVYIMHECSRNWITMCDGTDSIKDAIYCGEEFTINCSNFSGNYNWQKVTPEEKAQYIECKRQGKFVPLSSIKLKPKYYVY